jgi:hypothetical protein
MFRLWPKEEPPMKCTGIVLGLIAALIGSPALAQNVMSSESRPLAPLAGPNYTPALGQWFIGFYGTDLGFTMKHAGQLRIVFGDSWAGPLIPTIGLIGDDSQGTICLSLLGCPFGGFPLPSGEAVEDFVGSGGSFFNRPGPPLVFRTSLGSVAPIDVFAGGAGFLELPLAMRPGRTPVTVFSNGKSGLASGAFALFSRGEAVSCTGSCSEGWTCDATLGLDAAGAICPAGAPGCSSGAGAGVCVDTASPRFDASSFLGHVRGAVFRMRIGNADRVVQERYYTRAWDTHRFLNPAAVTVEDYDVGFTTGLGASSVDHAAPAEPPASGAEKVFLFGRPSFAGTDAKPANVFLAVASVPSFSSTGSFAWDPRFFAGFDIPTGQPRFSPDESDAVPLGDQFGNPMEPLNIVNQMSVRFLPQIQKWAMLYGGDVVGTGLRDLFSVGQAAEMHSNPELAVHIRFADDPWGPWSAPVPLLSGAAQYAPGGVLHTASCAPPLACVQGEIFWDLFVNPPSQPGFLYGANLIPEWSVVVDANTLDIYYNVSTFAPYQVVLMKGTVHH